MSCDCCNKLPQIWWLKTMQAYPVVNSRGHKSGISLAERKSRCWWGRFFLWNLKGKSLSCCFPSLAAAYIPWLVAPSSIKIHHSNV